MGYVKYQAEKAAVKGGLSFGRLVFWVIGVLLVGFWPLAVGEHSAGHPSWIGYLIEAIWLPVVVGVVALYKYGQAQGRR